MRKLRLVLIGASLLFFLIILFPYIYLTRAYIKEEMIIYVSPGESFLNILSNINASQQNFIGPIVSTYLRFNHLTSTLKRGEFRVPKKSSLIDIIEILSLGKNRIYHPITFPEGFTNFQIIQRMKEKGLFCGDEVENKALEGIYFPDTYFIEKCSHQEDLLTRMKQKQTEILDQLWLVRNHVLPYQTKEEALIVASLIERETNLDEERALIAGVMMNRIKKRMHLNIDATIIYAMMLQDPSIEIKRLKYEHLKLDSPYNTYKKRGLPPTPIANPGLASLKAAFNPIETDYLYYVFDPVEKKHVFSKTLEAHNKNRKFVAQKAKYSSE